MREMLAVIAKAYGRHVDVEFTVNFRRDGSYRINLLQCRPFQIKMGDGVPRAARTKAALSEVVPGWLQGEGMGPGWGRREGQDPAQDAPREAPQRVRGRRRTTARSVRGARRGTGPRWRPTPACPRR